MEVKKQYCLPIYNLDTIDEIPDDELQLVINDQLFLETLLMEIRGKSISYATYKKKSINKDETESVKKIQTLEDNLVEENIPNLEKLKQELCNLREEKMQGFLVHSRANIIDQRPMGHKVHLNSAKIW